MYPMWDPFIADETLIIPRVLEEKCWYLSSSDEGEDLTREAQGKKVLLHRASVEFLKRQWKGKVTTGS